MSTIILIVGAIVVVVVVFLAVVFGSEGPVSDRYSKRKKKSKGKNAQDERPSGHVTIRIGCYAGSSFSTRSGSTVSEHSYTLSSPRTVSRPRRGFRTIELACPLCGRRLGLEIHSATEMRSEATAQSVGIAMIGGLFAIVLCIIGLGQTSIGYYVAAGVVAAIFTLLALARGAFLGSGIELTGHGSQPVDGVPGKDCPTHMVSVD